VFDNGRRKNGFFTMFLTSLLTSLGVGILLIFAVTGFVTGNRSTAPQTPQGGSGIEMPSPQQISAEQSIIRADKIPYRVLRKMRQKLW